MATPFSPELLRAEHPEHDPDDIGFVESFDEVIAHTYPRILNRYKDASRRRTEYGKEKYHLPQSLIIVAGHEGSGKTRVTKRKLELWNEQIVVIEKDPISNKFSTGRSDRKDPVHGAMRPTVYRAMYHFADELLKLGATPVLDAPFNKFEDFFHDPAWTKSIRELAARNGVDVKVIWCEASPDTRYNRIVARNAAQDVERSEEQKRTLASRIDRPVTDFPMFVFNTEDLNPEETERSGVSLRDFLGAVSHSTSAKILIPQTSFEEGGRAADL
jgi:predicted kinase